MLFRSSQASVDKPSFIPRYKTSYDSVSIPSTIRSEPWNHLTSWYPCVNYVPELLYLQSGLQSKMPSLYQVLFQDLFQAMSSVLLLIQNQALIQVMDQGLSLFWNLVLVQAPFLISFIGNYTFSVGLRSLLITLQTSHLCSSWYGIYFFSISWVYPLWGCLWLVVIPYCCIAPKCVIWMKYCLQTTCYSMDSLT